MSVFKPNKRGHQALRHLASGPATFSGVASAVTYASKAERRKVWLVLRALVEDGLVEVSGGAYALTAEGAEALRALDQGVSWSAASAAPAPTVRVLAPTREAA